MRNSANALIAIFLFVFGLAVRLPGIRNATPQPDEHHWIQRSHITLNNLKEGRFTSFDAHLGHPGVPPSLLMTFSEWVVLKYNGNQGIEKNDPRYVDRLTAARVAIALCSSLIFPVLYLGAVSLIGVEVAFLGSLLLTLSPNHIFLSRLAHLDALLTLFITLSVLCFALGEQRQQARWKMFGGICWGLAIATKPTAGFIIIGLVLYKLARRFVLRLSNYTLITWSDLWAILLGHAVFGLIYTRLWQAHSRYVYKYHIENALTRFFLSTGKTLEAYPGVVLGICALVLLSSLMLVPKVSAKFSKFSFNLAMAVFTLGCLLLAISLVPDVLANFVRYWVWGTGLAKMEHRSYGMTWDPPPYGYFGLVVTRVPLIVLIGVVAGSLFVMSKEERKRRDFYLLILCCVLSWGGLLSVSSKQTLRYLMPVIPLLYLVAARGVVGVTEVVTQKLSTGLLQLRVRYAILSGVLLTLLISLFNIQPHYAFYGNALSGGVLKEVNSGRPLPVVGTDQAIDFLQEKAKISGREQWVMVLGDLDILIYTYRRRYPIDHQRLRFIAFSDFTGGDFLLVFPGFQRKVEEALGPEHQNLKPAFTYAVSAVPLLTVFELPLPEYWTGQTLDVTKIARKTGEIEAVPASNSLSGVVAWKGKNKEGYLLFGKIVRIAIGNFIVEFPMVLPEVVPSDSSAKHVVRLEFGKCKRDVLVNELTTTELRTIKLECSADEPKAAQLRVYWFGDFSVYLGDPSIRQLR